MSRSARDLRSMLLIGRREEAAQIASEFVLQIRLAQKRPRAGCDRSQDAQRALVAVLSRGAEGRRFDVIVNGWQADVSEVALTLAATKAFRERLGSRRSEARHQCSSA